jgi:hypothetical protein
MTFSCYCVTACQHQRALLEHRAREAGVPARHVYLPECDAAGNFEVVQCHPATTTCWCVDALGLETPGTRVSQPATPNCKVSSHLCRRCTWMWSVDGAI